jgi:ABC-type bacteriocin/lantibiotic exporter with double-glycine peptidase domain
VKPRRFLAPEVVQTSAMDCGPAALKSLLGGFGIRVSYGRLREACQIDLDGTSIDTLEEVAGLLGLEAEQVMVPPDHLLLPAAQALPAIVVVHQPNGLTHFIVVWRVHGRFVQVMDPATGRRWSTPRQLFDQLHVHRMPVPAAAWREWAGTPEFLAPLSARLRALGATEAEAIEQVGAGIADPGWKGLAALDAAARMTASVIASGGLSPGRPAARLFATLAERARAAAEDPDGPVPEAYWSVRPGPPGTEGEEQLLLRGAVLVRARGRRSPDGAAGGAGLSPELAAALSEPPSRPGREMLRLLREGGAFAPAALVLAMVAAGLGVAFEALLFRAFFDLGSSLGLSSQRLGAIALLFAFVSGLLLLDLPITLGSLRLGRHLEVRLRLAFLAKVPRLGDRYFGSRLTSDMAERSHGVHRLRLVSELGESFLRAAAELVATLAGIVWLDPAIFPLALAIGAAVLGVPLLLLPFLAERDLLLRNHTGALARFYLDALLGLFPIRTHGAQEAVRRQHESLLVEWSRAQLGLQAANVTADTILQVLMLSLTVTLVFVHLAHQGLDGSVLLLFFWAFNVFTQGHMLTLMIATQYPSHRNVALRLLEPLGAPEESSSPAAGATHTPAGTAVGGGGIALRFEGVAVKAAGHTILCNIDLAVAAGEQVAIVGPSGAGKSSLVGVLLGWHRPAEGRVTVDGAPLSAERLAGLRRETAWVDPAVQIWNRSLLDNLRYGSPDGLGLPLDQAVRQADLLGVLRQLPEGLQTTLGEGGGLVSGGEGQRVRFGRALLRPGVRLAILDEPFRGLDREQRRELLARARQLWRRATLLCVTHDVGETLGFDRVLVIEAGRIVEDGRPAALQERPGSRYRALLDAEQEVREGLWSSAGWRRLRMEAGRLSEDGRDE